MRLPPPSVAVLSSEPDTPWPEDEGNLRVIYGSKVNAQGYPRRLLSQQQRFNEIVRAGRTAMRLSFDPTLHHTTPDADIGIIRVLFKPSPPFIWNFVMGKPTTEWMRMRFIAGKVFARLTYERYRSQMEFICARNFLTSRQAATLPGTNAWDTPMPIIPLEIPELFDSEGFENCGDKNTLWL